MQRINVPLSQAEMTALVKIAEAEYRHPRAQAALLIRVELKRQGLLSGLAGPRTAAAEAAKELRNKIEPLKRTGAVSQ